MRNFRVLLFATIAVTGLATGTSCGQGSTAPPTGAPQNPATATSPSAKKQAIRKSTTRAAQKTRVIPMESAPPSPPPSPADEAAQKAKDQRLLEEQKRQSEQAAQVTNQQVEKAQKQQESVQKEVRIQDAPGPAQTGVVPAAGRPVAPASTDQRIQDAPGPAQTLPQPVPAQPQPSGPPEV